MVKLLRCVRGNQPCYLVPERIVRIEGLFRSGSLVLLDNGESLGVDEAPEDLVRRLEALDNHPPVADPEPAE